MTTEQMKAQAERVVEALKAADGFNDVELTEFTPGESLPICFSADVDGDEELFCLSLNLA